MCSCACALALVCCRPPPLQAQKHLEETRKAKADAEALRRECAVAQDEVAKLKRQVKKLQRDNESLKQLETNITHYYRNNRSQRQHGAHVPGANGASAAGSVAGSVRGGASVIDESASVRDAGAASTHTRDHPARDGAAEAGNALQWARAQLAGGAPAQHGAPHPLQSVSMSNLQQQQVHPHPMQQQHHQQQQQQRMPAGPEQGGRVGDGGGGDENDATIRRVNAMIAAKRAGRPMSAGQRSTGSGGSGGSGRRTSWGGDGGGGTASGGGIRQPVRSHPMAHLDETPGPIQTGSTGEPSSVQPGGGVCSTDDPKTPLPHLGPGGVIGAQRGGGDHAHPHRQRLLAQQQAAQQAYSERQAQMQIIRQRMEEEEASRGGGRGADDAYDYAIPAMQSQLQNQFYQRAQEQHMAQRQQRRAQEEAAAAAHAHHASQQQRQPMSARSNGSASTNASARFSTARSKQRRGSRPAGGGAAAVAAARRSRKHK